MIDQAHQLAAQVGVTRACQVLTVPRSSFYHTPRRSGGCAPPSTRRPGPPRALNEAQRLEVRDVLNNEEFCEQAPPQVWARLLDEGRYLCSWRTMYRILDAFAEVRERRNQLRHPTYTKPELMATAPKEVWRWDITKLRGPAKGIYFYLYVILDLFSRYVVGWMVAPRERAELAHVLVDTTCQRQAVLDAAFAAHPERFVGGRPTVQPLPEAVWIKPP